MVVKRTSTKGMVMADRDKVKDNFMEEASIMEALR